MKPVIVVKKADGLLDITEESLSEILKEVYQSGYNDGFNAGRSQQISIVQPEPWWQRTYLPINTPIITCNATGKE